MHFFKSSTWTQKLVKKELIPFRCNIGFVRCDRVTTFEARDDMSLVRTGANLNLPVLFYFTISESESTPFVFVLGFLYFCTQTPLSNLALAECQVGIVTFFPEKQFLFLYIKHLSTFISITVSNKKIWSYKGKYFSYFRRGLIRNVFWSVYFERIIFSLRIYLRTLLSKYITRTVKHFTVLWAWISSF